MEFGELTLSEIHQKIKEELKKIGIDIDEDERKAKEKALENTRNYLKYSLALEQGRFTLVLLIDLQRYPPP